MSSIVYKYCSKKKVKRRVYLLKADDVLFVNFMERIEDPRGGGAWITGGNPPLQEPRLVFTLILPFYQIWPNSLKSSLLLDPARYENM